jgi:uncharacterized protein (DUF362 family)
MSTVMVQNVLQCPDISGILAKLGIDGSGTVIKPNWSTPDPGFFVDGEGLDFLLSRIPGPKYVIESYMYGRTEDHQRITPTNAREHREWFREQEARFLERHGLAAAMKRHGAEYINLTEEEWSGRCVEPETVRRIVEARFPAVKSTDLYARVPERVFALRHLPMISYAKIKYQIPKVGNYSTFTIKNLFGLLPEPNRHEYHDRGLPQSVVDSATIYQALFRVVGIIDAIRTVAVYREPGKNPYRMIFTDYDLIRDQGLLLASTDLLTLDAYTNRMVGKDPDTHEVLALAASTWGPWDTATANAVPEALRAIFRPYLGD